MLMQGIGKTFQSEWVGGDQKYLLPHVDQAGLDWWTSELNNDLANGVGYNHIIRAFIVSLEYRSRFGQPCGGFSDMTSDCR